MNTQAPFSSGAWQLYDLSIDRGEVNDLSAARPEIATRLLADYNDYAARSGVIPVPAAVPRAPAP